MAKSRVLWIEDSAFDENRLLTTPVYMAGKYDLQIETSASDGMRALRKGPFDAVVVDIRLPPGSGEEWLREFEKAAKDKVAARLGLVLLDRLLGPAYRENREPGLGWVQPELFGVLTVETYAEIHLELNRFGVRVYHQKQGVADRRLLLRVIEEILG